MVRNEKFRGKRTHGHGKKGGRGHGKRGGRGNAGGHKHHFIKTLKEDRYHFGRYGFKRPQSTITKKTVLNVGSVQEKVLKYGKDVDKTVELDLSALGYDKLLGSGNISIPVKIKISEATENAINKINNAGGEVELDA